MESLFKKDFHFPFSLSILNYAIRFIFKSQPFNFAKKSGAGILRCGIDFRKRRKGEIFQGNQSERRDRNQTPHTHHEAQGFGSSREKAGFKRPSRESLRNNFRADFGRRILTENFFDRIFKDFHLFTGAFYFRMFVAVFLLQIPKIGFEFGFSEN